MALAPHPDLKICHDGACGALGLIVPHPVVVATKTRRDTAKEEANVRVLQYRRASVTRIPVTGNGAAGPIGRHVARLVDGVFERDTECAWDRSAKGRREMKRLVKLLLVNVSMCGSSWVKIGWVGLRSTYRLG